MDHAQDMLQQPRYSGEVVLLGLWPPSTVEVLLGRRLTWWSIFLGLLCVVIPVLLLIVLWLFRAESALFRRADRTSGEL
jgi:steroid 5-alpha reductase family enzyme